MLGKPQLREEMRRRLRAAAPTDRAAWSARMVAHLLSLPQFIESRKVLLFAPLATEPNFLTLLDDAPRPGQTLVFPRMVGTSLTLHEVHSLDDLVPGTAKVREPLSSLPEVRPEEIALALVPGLAFDPATGDRLGRGGGYFDRFLGQRTFRGFPLGVCFSFQLQGSLPVESHDVRVNGVLTERGVER